MSELSIVQSGEQVRRVQHGEPLTPEIANRPIDDIVEWLSNITNQVQAFTETACNILYDQPLDEKVHVGAPVYLNRATTSYSRARASYRVENDQLAPDDSCFVIGIVIRKTSPTTGHICVSGVADIDFEEGGNQDAHQDYTSLGLRYLSSLEEGRVTPIMPAMAIPVAFVLNPYGNDEKVRIAVNINFDRLPFRHAHYRLPITAAPAGEYEKHDTTIHNPDPKLEGWLPIDPLEEPPENFFDELFGEHYQEQKHGHHHFDHSNYNHLADVTCHRHHCCHHGSHHDGHNKCHFTGHHKCHYQCYYKCQYRCFLRRHEDGPFKGIDVPVGAKFGYNVAKSEIKDHFPLVFPSAFKLYWSQYTNEGDPLPVIGEVPDDLYIITADGIWWMSDEYLPWYRDATWVIVEVEDVPMAVCDDLPNPMQQKMLAYYTCYSYGIDEPVVTSLSPAPASGLEIYDTKTKELACRGDLEIDFDFRSKIASEVFDGSMALKYIGEGHVNATSLNDTECGEYVKRGFFFGPTVESVEADSITVRVVSENNVRTSDGKKSGRIKLKMDDSWDRLPLPVQSVHLDQMRDQFLGGMVALTFFPGQKSGFSGSVYVPWFSSDESEPIIRYIKIRLTLVCGAVGQVNNEMFTGRFIRIPAAHCNPSASNPWPVNISKLCNPHNEENDLEFEFDVQVEEQYTYFCIESKKLEVKPGDMVWFSFHKEAGGYEGPLSVIKIEGKFSDE